MHLEDFSGRHILEMCFSIQEQEVNLDTKRLRVDDFVVEMKTIEGAIANRNASLARELAVKIIELTQGQLSSSLPLEENKACQGCKSTCHKSGNKFFPLEYGNLRWWYWLSQIFRFP